jgi:hypothetical protein
LLQDLATASQIGMKVTVSGERDRKREREKVKKTEN